MYSSLVHGIQTFTGISVTPDVFTVVSLSSRSANVHMNRKNVCIRCV